MPLPQAPGERAGPLRLITHLYNQVMVPFPTKGQFDESNNCPRIYKMENAYNLINGWQAAQSSTPRGEQCPKRPQLWPCLSTLSESQSTLHTHREQPLRSQMHTCTYKCKLKPSETGTAAFTCSVRRGSPLSGYIPHTILNGHLSVCLVIQSFCLWGDSDCRLLRCLWGDTHTGQLFTQPPQLECKRVSLSLTC